MLRLNLSEAVINHLEELYKADPAFFANNFIDKGNSKRRLFFVNVAADEAEIRKDIAPLISRELRQRCLSLIKQTPHGLTAEYISNIRFAAEILFLQEITNNEKWDDFWHKVTSETLTTEAQQYRCYQKIVGTFMYKIIDTIGKNAEKEKLEKPSHEEHILLTKILSSEGNDSAVLKDLEDDYINKAIKLKLPLNDLEQYMIRVEEENESKFLAALNNWTKTLASIRNSYEFRQLGKRGDLALMDWLIGALNHFNNHIKRNAKTLDKICRLILKFIKQQYANQALAEDLAQKIQILATIALTIAKSDTQKKYESLRKDLIVKTPASQEKAPERKESTFGAFMRNLPFTRARSESTVVPGAAKAGSTHHTLVHAQTEPSLQPRNVVDAQSPASPPRRTGNQGDTVAPVPASAQTSTVRVNTQADRKNLFASQSITPARTVAARPDREEKQKRRKSLLLDWFNKDQNADADAAITVKKDKRRSMMILPAVQKDPDVLDATDPQIVLAASKSKQSNRR